MKVKYLKQKPTGLYYFRRNIPEDLRKFYKGKLEHNHSLGTHNESKAIKECQKHATKYDQEFDLLRKTGDRTKALELLKSYNLAPIPIEDQLPNQERIDGNPYDQLLDDLADKHNEYSHYSELEKYEEKALDILQGHEKITLEQIKEEALDRIDIPQDKPIQFRNKQHEIRRAFRYFQDLLNSDVLEIIRRKQVQDATDKLGKKFKTFTVKKSLGTVRKNVRKSIYLHELSIQNPFDGIEIVGVGKDSDKKLTFSLEQLNLVEKFVLKDLNNKNKQVIGLLVNTGARCGEIGGLRLSDIVLDHKVPHLNLEEYSARGIKTGKNRKTPLVGLSLEVAKHIIANTDKKQEHVFPIWIKDGEYKFSSCNTSVNNHVKAEFKGYTSHCFRHTIRDRLREADIRNDKIDSICGWGKDDMQEQYGQTQRLEVLEKALLETLEFEKKEMKN